MAPKVFFVFVLFALLLVPPSSSFSLKPAFQIVGRRNLLEKNHVQQYSDEIQPSVKKNQGTTTIALGTTTQTKNNTKLTTTANSTKNSKLQEKTNLKKLNSTSKPSNLTKPTSKTSTLSSKSSNLTKPTSKTPTLSSKSSNLTKPTSKTSTSSSKSSNLTKPTSKTPTSSSKPSNSTKPTSKSTNSTSILTQKSKTPPKKNTPTTPSKKSTKPINALTFLEDDDFVTEIKDLPSRFQETLIPDLEVISTTSKSYLNKANKRISNRVNPFVGKKYAPIVASIISFIFILIPFLLVSLIFNRIKSYFSLQKLIIFIQIYLSIYFSILSLSSLITGIEPLRFFYATSQSTYVCVQLLQTLGYVLYLVLLLMYLVLVFSTENGVVSKLLGVGQMVVGMAVGLHYYMSVLHRAVLRRQPKTSWKVNTVYATCFLVICLLATAERRKKAYMVDGCEEGKKN